MAREWCAAVVLVGVALYCCPTAAAEVRRFTDGRGVVHITNVAPAPPRSASPPSFTEPSPEPPPGLPLTPEPTGLPDLAEMSAGQAIYLAPTISSSVSETEQAWAAPPASAAEAAPAPPSLTPVSWSGEDLHRPRQPEVGSSPQAAPRVEGAIRRYRDAQGVWHIGNVEQGKPEPPAATLVQAGAGGAPEKRPEAPVPRRDGAREQLPLRKVDWSSQDFPQARPPKLTAAAKAAGPPGAIRRYRDARGVLHITNLAPGDAEAPTPPLLQARDGPAPVRGDPFNLEQDQTIGDKRARASPSLKMAAWSGEESAPPSSAAAVASREASAVPAFRTIRRHRDARGVLHLKSVEPATPEPLPAATQLAGPVPGGSGGGPPPGVGPPLALRPREARAEVPPAYGLSVVAFRDRQGKLTIRNRESEAPAGRAPPTEWAAAGLEAVILEAAQHYRLPIALVQALIKVESNFVPWAVSPKGAMGLMQLMPGTAEFLGVKDPFCPRENILGGCRYLRLLLDNFNDCLPLALAAYNAGYQRVISSGFRIPPIKETQDFVTQVLGRYYLAAKRDRQSWI